MQYLYKEGNDYVMMNTETYEQLNVPESAIGDGVKYLKENNIRQGMSVKIE